MTSPLQSHAKLERVLVAAQALLRTLGVHSEFNGPAPVTGTCELEIAGDGKHVYLAGDPEGTIWIVEIYDGDGPAIRRTPSMFPNYDIFNALATVSFYLNLIPSMPT